MDQALKMMMTGVDAVMDTTSQPRRIGEEEDITGAQVTTRPELLSGDEVQGALDDCVMPGPSVDQPAELQLLKDEEVALLDSNGQHMRRGMEDENLLGQDTTEPDQETVQGGRGRLVAGGWCPTNAICCPVRQVCTGGTWIGG